MLSSATDIISQPPAPALRVYPDLTAAADLPEGPLHLAIGMFDGVHRGHQRVIAATVAAAQQEAGITGVLTFTPHPSRLFRPQDPVRLILTPEQRLHLLARFGVQIVINQAFDAAFASIPPKSFLERLVQALPTLRAVYVGDNWRFGEGRRGDVALLQAQAAHYDLRVFCAPRLNAAEEAVSSTRIRSALADGQVAVANTLLGYPYFAEAVVQRGRQLGRTLGFPTLNLPWSPELRPRYGVYAVRVRGLAQTTWHAAVANYGVRPTVETSGEVEPSLEVHLLSDCPFTTGDALLVEWWEFLRPEQRFGDLSALRAQIGHDRERAAEFWQRQG